MYFANGIFDRFTAQSIFFVIFLSRSGKNKQMQTVNKLFTMKFFSWNMAQVTCTNTTLHQVEVIKKYSADDFAVNFSHSLQTSMFNNLLESISQSQREVQLKKMESHTLQEVNISL